MSYKTCTVKNIDQVPHTYCGQEIAAEAVYRIEDQERLQWANDNAVLAAITYDEVLIGDGINFLTSYNDQINWLKDY